MKLTEAQQRVAAYVADGYTNQQIAQELGLSFHTIRNHVHNIMNALGAKTRFEVTLHLAQQQQTK
jgi:DNA-binding NarL/FixJ family response regulator